MDGKIFGLLVLGIVFVLCATAYAGVNLEITKVKSYDIDDGEPINTNKIDIGTDIYGLAEFEILVNNTGDEDAEDVTLEFYYATDSDATFTIKPSKKDIDADDYGVFEVTLTGLEPEQKNIEVEVMATGENQDGDDRESVDVTFYVSFPKTQLEIIEPDTRTDILELGPGNSFSLKVFVKNTGETDLFELNSSVMTKNGNVSCEIMNEIEKLKKDRVASIDLDCTNVNDRDSITVKVSDGLGITSDLRSIDLHIVPGAPIIVPDEPLLIIQSPMDGELIQLKEENNQIPVTVINEGNLLAEGVCVSWTGIDAVGDDCADIEPNETQPYIIAVSEIPKSADVVITTGDSEGLTTDTVSVSVIKGRTTFDVEWEDNQSVVLEGNVTDVRNTSEGNTTETETPVEEEDPTLKYIIVGVVVLILVVYMVIGMGRKRHTGVISQ